MYKATHVTIDANGPTVWGTYLFRELGTALEFAGKNTDIASSMAQKDTYEFHKDVPEEEGLNMILVCETKVHDNSNVTLNEELSKSWR